MMKVDMLIPSLAATKISSFQTTAPVDVKAIAQSFDLEIYQAEMSAGVSGALIKDAKYKTKSGFVILVNKREPNVRQRFTAAHEIGHFILHKELIGEKFEENYMLRSDKTSNKQEQEANRFAAETLMPFNLINKLCSEGLQTIDELAEKLEVSKIAMAIRLGYPT